MQNTTPFLYQIYKLLSKFILIFLFIIGINFVLMPMAHRVSGAEKPRLSKYAETGDEKFDKIFREGRDLIDKEEWASAVAKFNQITCDCPEKKYVDAAFYWLAFSYKKQKMYKEMDETIVRLLKNFPDSSWADDARVLQLTVSPVSRATMPGSIYQSSTGSPSTNIYFPAGELTGIATTATSQTPLDREDETKLAAFHSLYSADTKRGIEVLGDILKTDSKASETLKREVLRSIRNRSLLFSSYPQSSLIYETQTTTDNKNQFTPLLRETLVKSYQNESNVKIRTEIIYTLANINDDQSFNYIVQLYASESNKELKKAIINSFGGSSFYTFGSYSNLATTVAGQNIAATIGSNSNANSAKNIRFDKLMEIIRTEKDIELKRLAFSNLQRFVGWSTKDGMVDTISGLYDAETDEQFKISIIRSFAGSKQNQAAVKLMNIARTDKSDKLRLEAIRSLSASKDPEVLKFLEDLIK